MKKNNRKIKNLQWLRVYTDGELQSDEFNLTTAQSLQDGGPWGQNFPEPAFNGRFLVLQQRIVGHKHLKIVLQHPSSKQTIDAIAFNIDPLLWPNSAIKQLDLVYKLDINEYRDQLNLQLMVNYMQPVS